MSIVTKVTVLHDNGLIAGSSPTLGMLWTVAHQAPLSMGFPRQEYWSGLLFPFPGDIPKTSAKARPLVSLLPLNPEVLPGLW